MHIAIISNLYPNCVETTKGLFIKQFAERLAEKVEVTVISPVPWIPAWLHKLTGKGLDIPEIERIGTLKVHHPRYVVIPKIMRFTYGWFYYLGIRKLLQLVHRDNPIDLISAHWIYPDGYGAVLIADQMNIPITLHARGCDINDYTKYFLRKKLIRHALQKSSLNFSVSSEIKKRITSLGIPADKTVVVLNGVNQQIFKRRDKLEARQRLSLNPAVKYLLYVGNLQHEKGVNYLIDAVAMVRNIDFTLLIVGDGPEKGNIENQIRTHGLENKVLMKGRAPHDDIPIFLAASDLLCLPSLREGCPNIILESLSVGTRVLASCVGAIPDIVDRPEWGILVPPEDAEALAKGISESLELQASPIPKFNWYDWDQNADRVLEIFKGLVRFHENLPPR